MTTSVTIALASLVSIAGLWLLLFWLYRDYCIDKFRQDMFALRDEMFDAAARGDLPFDSQAYGVLRVTMNGFIRFAHRFTLLQALLLVAIAREGVEEGADSFAQRWSTATKTLEPTKADLVTRYRTRMNVLVVRYVLLSSPILVLTLIVPLVGLVALKLCVSELLRILRSPLDGLDSAALTEGQA